MAVQADALAALIDILRRDEDGDATEVEVITEGRIFGGIIDLDDQAEMPGPTVRLNYSGGRSLGGYAHLERPRVDITYYGRTHWEADKVRRTAHPILKDLQRRVARGVLIHGLENTGGYAQGLEQGTNWPYIFTSWDVLAAEQAVE